MPETMDLTPTPQEYANIARLFARAVVDDARDERRHDTGVMLAQLVELVAYLARIQSDADVQAFLALVKQEADRPAALCRYNAVPRCPHAATGRDGYCDECREAVAAGDDQ